MNAYIMRYGRDYPEQARAYLKRFELVEDLRTAEMRRASVESRFMKAIVPKYLMNGC